jgi:hypothetical protein
LSDVDRLREWVYDHRSAWVIVLTSIVVIAGLLIGWAAGWTLPYTVALTGFSALSLFVYMWRSKWRSGPG